MTRLLLALFIVLVPLTAGAGPRLGMEVGGALVWTEFGAELNYEDVDLGSRPEFNAAATVHVDLGRRWGLTTGIRYSRLGNEFNVQAVQTPSEPYGNGTSESGTLSYRQQYIGVPLFARLRFTDERGPYLFGGPEIAWLIDATQEVSIGSEPSQEANISDRYRSYNVVAVLGAGYDFEFVGHALEMAVRFGYGLTDARDHGDFLYTSTKQYTREFAITLGFRW